MAKPADWNPSNPKDGVCIFCYEKGTRYVAWRYGANCVCMDPRCVRNAKRMPGYAGHFEKKAQAVGRAESERLIREEKSSRGRRK